MDQAWNASMSNRVRKSARALVQNASGDVLLLKFSFPGLKDSTNTSGTTFWVTPGGGLKAGETFDAALRRELREELGIDVGPNPRCVWVQDVAFEDEKGAFISHERFFLVKHSGELNVNAMSEIEKQTFGGFRWWSLTEMQAERESIRPVDLPELMRDLEQTTSIPWPGDACHLPVR